MNRTLCLLTCALSMSVASLAAQPSAAPSPGWPPRTVSVSGEAEIRVVPDEAVLTLGVETFDADLGAAKAASDQRVAAVLAALRARGVPDDRVSTDYLVLQPRYEGRSDNRHVIIGHVVRKTVVVTLRDVSAFDAVLGAAVGAGATHIHGVDFRTTQLRAHRDRARALAVDAAREKAEAMAGRLGQRVGRALTLSEGHSGWWSGYGEGWGRRDSGMTQNVVQEAGGGGGGAGGESTTPGQIAIKGNVSVVFELLP
ncbi:MAG TPA: SIMPL domain-containing protein [Longimicrobium sp.]|nr:SIMPL domain-containing protein [Longimicrobium sp.]